MLLLHIRHRVNDAIHRGGGRVSRDHFSCFCPFAEVKNKTKDGRLCFLPSLCLRAALVVRVGSTCSSPSGRQRAELSFAYTAEGCCWRWRPDKRENDIRSYSAEPAGFDGDGEGRGREKKTKQNKTFPHAVVTATVVNI